MSALCYQSTFISKHSILGFCSLSPLGAWAHRNQTSKQSRAFMSKATQYSQKWIQISRKTYSAYSTFGVHLTPVYLSNACLKNITKSWVKILLTQQWRAKFNICCFHLNKFIQDSSIREAKAELQEWEMCIETSSSVDLIVLHTALPADLCHKLDRSMLSPVQLLGALTFNDFMATRYVIFYLFWQICDMHSMQVELGNTLKHIK